MKNSLGLQPNKPRCITQVLDLKIIGYSQTVQPSKQAYGTPPVLLKNVGRSPRVTQTKVLPSAPHVAYPLMRHHAQGPGLGALPCTFPFILDPYTTVHFYQSPTFRNLIFSTRSRRLRLNRGVAPPGLTHLAYRWRARLRKENANTAKRSEDALVFMF